MPQKKVKPSAAGGKTARAPASSYSGDGKTKGAKPRPPKNRAKHKLLPALARATTPHSELVIITGMSGAGKGSVLRAFEDLGYYCVDNLPVELIPRFAELSKQSAEIERAALVADIREGAQLEKLPAILKSLKQQVPTTVLFMESSDDSLVRRFSENAAPAPAGALGAGEVSDHRGTQSSAVHPQDRGPGD